MNLRLLEWIANMIDTTPVGKVVMYAGATAPKGWLLCNGQAVSRTTYAALFNVIGTTWGSGDGSTTFNVPDIRDRFPVGAGNTYALNDSGGAKNVTLDTTQIPSHQHGSNTSGRAFVGTPAGASIVRKNAGSSGTAVGNVLTSDQAFALNSVTGPTGGGQAHENRPPYRAFNFIIFVGGGTA